jgi:hypothetical protein
MSFARRETVETTLDGSVYPDQDPPDDLVTESQKADYMHRVVTAFDHGVVPDEPTLELLSRFRDVFDKYPLNASPGYHALRCLFGWESVERLPFFDEPTYLKFDRIEGRTDGCEDML